MNRTSTRSAFLLAIAWPLWWGFAWGHPDLELQIEQLTGRISGEPHSAELLLKRGDLYRRHADWPRASRDFALARDLDPDHRLLDWYEGRLQVEAGRPQDGVRLLTRFIEMQPPHAGAFRVRAEAYWRMGQPEASARDFAQSISVSEKPAPALYRSLVIAQQATGRNQYPAAMASVDTGLERFPGEISLLGLGADLALAGADTIRAATYLAGIQTGLLALPQWQYRRALLACLEGDSDRAASGFASLGGDALRAGTWSVPREAVLRLAAEPEYESCLEAASDMLEGLQP